MPNFYFGGCQPKDIQDDFGSGTNIGTQDWYFYCSQKYNQKAGGRSLAQGTYLESGISNHASGHYFNGKSREKKRARIESQMQLQFQEEESILRNKQLAFSETTKRKFGSCLSDLVIKDHGGTLAQALSGEKQGHLRAVI